MLPLSPPVAALLSLVVPGLGQALPGHRQRGLLLFFLAFVYAALLAALDLSPLSWLALLPYWGVVAADAAVLAAGRRPDMARLLLAGALPLYVIGWQVTNIDLERLVSSAGKARIVLSGLMRPRLLDREITYAVARQSFALPCPADGDVGPALPTQQAAQGGTLESSITCGVPGDKVRVTGRGFPADQTVALWWISNINSESRLRIFDQFTDFSAGPDGSFEGEISIPQVQLQPGTSLVHRLEVRYVTDVGPWFISDTSKLVFDRMLETIALGLMATFAGAILAMPFSIFGARNLMAGNPLLVFLYYLSRVVMNILRAVEPLIMAIVFVVWVGLGPFAGVLALMVHTVAALGKLYSEAIEGIDPGPIEAIRSTGANQMQIIVYGVIPQVVPPWIAFTVYRWDINVRMSTIIGFVGGGGVGFLLAQWIRLADYRSAGAAILGIAIIVSVLDLLSAQIRERVV